MGLLVVTAGCLGFGAGPAGEASPTASGDGEDPAAAGLASPPTWEAGDWWKIRFTDPSPEADGATYTTKRVVAGERNGSYLVGMPSGNFSDELLIWHMPGFGNVDNGTLGFLVHGEPFQPLQFPLEEGKTWSTSFIGSYEAEVVDVSNRTVTVAFTANSPAGSYTAMELVYDAKKGFIEEVVSHPGPVRGSAASHGRYEVVDHGTGYEGEVTVPVDRREVFFDVRVAGAWAGGPAPPGGSADVPDDVDRVTLAHVLGEIHGRGATTGYYQLTTTTPGGQEIQDQLPPASAPGRHVTYYGVWNGSGTWSFDHVAAGTGATVAEGIGYQVWNATLPGAKAP